MSDGLVDLELERLRLVREVRRRRGVPDPEPAPIESLPPDLQVEIRDILERRLEQRRAELRQRQRRQVLALAWPLIEPGGVVDVGPWRAEPEPITEPDAPAARVEPQADQTSDDEPQPAPAVYDVPAPWGEQHRNVIPFPTDARPRVWGARKSHPRPAAVCSGLQWGSGVASDLRRRAALRIVYRWRGSLTCMFARRIRVASTLARGWFEVGSPCWPITLRPGASGR